MTIKNIKRRSVLKTLSVAGIAAAASTSLSSPAISSGHKEWILVSAFGKKDFVLKAYKEAIKNKYRFHSYGDSMLIV